MATKRIWDRLLSKRNKNTPYNNGKSYTSWLRSLVAGSLYRVSDMHTDTDIADIKTQIDTMRALSKDSQISTALSYYATDATTMNSSNQIIWATSDDSDLASIINSLFKRWKINEYARDHILELATIGNLYIPTTGMYKKETQSNSRQKVAIDNNTIADIQFDIIPSTKICPEDVIHLYYHGEPQGYIYQPSDDKHANNTIDYPESAIIHFSLGGLLGDYTIDVISDKGDTLTYDIRFGQPLMDRAVQPTQTLNLLEDAIVLSSLVRVVRFVNVDCGDNVEDEDVRAALQMIKNAIEQQLSINTNNGDVQSYVNPQSPNNLIYVPKVNGNDPISITDLNMTTTEDSDSKLLEYYQDKKLSVLGVPKEAMNFSSNEGLGGAGSVLSQRSALYANSLQRLETAYTEGWRQALNTYFTNRGLSGYVDKFELHMNPIITEQSTINFDKRDSALNQATTLVQLFKDMGMTDMDNYREAISEILTEVFPKMGSDTSKWDINTEEGMEEGI